MKVSLCITVLNEEKTIARLLDSILNQTKIPNEIIIVDGGSQDKTAEIIKHYLKKGKTIHLLKEIGGIAHGRNTAIDLAKYPIIAQIDAGCVAESDWLEKLVKPLEHENVGISAGFYKMPSDSFMQKAINLYLGVHPKKYDSSIFIPSARSVAFKKSVWEKIGGYDEKLQSSGEDTKFFVSCVKNKIRIVRVGDALVSWEEIRNISLKNFFKKIQNYATGDIKTKIWIHPINGLMSHNIKALLVLIRHLIGLILLIFSFSNNYYLYLLVCLLFLYIFWILWKWRFITGSWRARAWLPVIQFTSDIAVISGFILGICNF